jgi:cell division protein FtsI (penicillin-binding protein 3)
LSFTDVIVKSSNVGAIKIGLRLGPERLGLYARRFGFGRALSPDFPGETSGILWDPAKLDASALASMSMGYQVGVTPLQMAAAVSSVANGGQLMQPRVVRAMVRDGKRLEVQPVVLGRSIRQDTAATLTGIMEQVVERGTAKTFANIAGYTIAGKTGTSHKLVNGHYSNSDYFASFVGFLPSRDPVATVIVVLDSPQAQGHFGGPIAGPVFQRIAEATLRHFGIGPTLNAPPPVLVARRNAPPELRPAGSGRASFIPVGTAGASSDLPDFRGLSAREVVRILTAMGLTARLHGSGVVAAQAPKPGSPIDPGTTCELWLERVPAAVEPLVAEH